MQPRRVFIERLDGRLHEWVMALAMIPFGIALLVWPQIIKCNPIQMLAGYFTAMQVGGIFISTGVASVAALIVNGASWKVGPRVRSVCAIIRGVMWVEFTLSMSELSMDQGYPSPMIFFWSVFTLAEIYIAYRAALDVRNN